MTAQFATHLPPKPQAIPFSLPNIPATETLRSRPQWVVWDYKWRPEKAKHDKPPLNPRTGHYAKSSDPATWADCETAVRYAKAKGLAGIGYVLTREDDLTGIDLDECRNKETGELEPWAASIIALAETYAEVSPSGEGVRLFAFGKVAAAIKSDAAHVEVYGEGRYLTVTGHKLPGVPDEIRPAPQTLAALQQRVAEFKAAAEDARHPRHDEAPASPRGEGQGFFASVNSEALASLARWVPDLFGSSARPQASTRGYRVTSRSLSRNLEEDLSITPQGIVDWGVHDMGDARDGKRTAIDLVMEHGGAADPASAARWLCDRLGLAPAKLGWRAHSETPRSTFFSPGGRQAANSNGPSMSAGSMARDRLAIALEPASQPEFPLDALPAVLRNAILALEDHVQAPRSLCAHAALGAAALAAQALANVQVPSITRPRPLVLYMLAIAASGERKSSLDDVALYAVRKHEEGLALAYEQEMARYKPAKAAYDAQKRKIENDKSLTYEARVAELTAMAEPPKPLFPSLRLKEATLEGLINFMTGSQGSIGIFTSEGGQFLGGHGMSQDARVRTITGLSELWDSGTIERIRAQEQNSVFLKGRRVSISLAAQPKIAASLIKDETAQDQGFLARFLVTMPESRIGLREIRDANAMDDARLKDFNRVLRRLLAHPPSFAPNARNELDPRVLPFSEEAKTLWMTLAQSLENDSGKGRRWEPIQATAAKMGENVARIAAILTLLENPTASEIGGDAMAGAGAVGLFYLQEALRLKGHDALDPATRDLLDLEAWLAKWPHEAISPVHFQKLAPRSLRRNVKETRAQIAQLCDAGVLEQMTLPKGETVTIDGRKCREAYRVIRDGGAA